MEEKKENLYKPGEKGFSVFLLLFGAYFLYESWKLYRQEPGASSYGAVPLFVSAVIVVFSLAILISDRKKKTIGYLFPLDVLVLFILIVLYCAGMQIGIGFVWMTPVFLWVSMSYLMRKGYIKNILWTALCMAFILLVFSYLFSVVLP